MPFRQLKSFLKILIGVQYENSIAYNRDKGKPRLLFYGKKV